MGLTAGLDAGLPNKSGLGLRAGVFTDKFHDAPTAGAAIGGLLAKHSVVRQGAGCSERVQQLRRCCAEHLLEQLQRGGHHVVVAVLRVVKGQLIHLQGTHTGGGLGARGFWWNPTHKQTNKKTNAQTNNKQSTVWGGYWLIKVPPILTTDLY